MEPPAPPLPIIDVGPLEGTSDNERKRIISMTLNLANGQFSYNRAEWDDIPVIPLLNQPLPYDPGHPQEVGNDARVAGGKINSIYFKGLSITTFRYCVWSDWPIEFFHYMQRCDIVHERN